MTTIEEKEHAEMEPLAHDGDCDCDECQDVRASMPDDLQEFAPALRNALAWIEDTERIVKATVAGAALLTALLIPGHADAREYPPITGHAGYDATCSLVHEWEDGSAISYCTEDGETYAFDADGGYMMDHGIVFYYRSPGTWYVAPEIMQIGPGAPVDAR